MTKYYGQDDGKREIQELKPRPSDRRIMIYLICSTVLNALLMALSYFVYKDNAVYTLKLAIVFQWIITVAIIDYYCYVIPNSLLLQALAMAIVFTFVELVFFRYPTMVALKDYFFGMLMAEAYSCSVP